MLRSGDGPRHSLHASAYYRQYNEDSIFLFGKFAISRLNGFKLLSVRRKQAKTLCLTFGVHIFSGLSFSSFNLKWYLLAKDVLCVGVCSGKLEKTGQSAFVTKFS